MEGDGARLGVDDRRVAADADPGRRADVAVGAACLDHTGAHPGTCAVASPHDHGGSRDQSGRIRRGGCDCADDRRRRDDSGQLLDREIKRIEKRLMPCPRAQIKEQRPRRVRIIGDEFARKSVDQIIFGLEKTDGLSIEFRLMGAQPKDLGGAIGRAGAVAGDAIDFLVATGCGHPLRLGLCALVRPNDAGAQRFALHAQRHTPHHLPAKGDGGDVMRVHAALRQQLLRRHDYSAPPIRGVLFRPVWLGIGRGIGRERTADQCAVGVEETGLVAGRTQVVG